MPKFVAFYLPQYHPIPENDKWWGKGFTEWTNVTKAPQLFAGHYQPHLPADLGFYDLRVNEVMHDQADLAKNFGIDGFCYHYYWFSGTRLLHKPLDSMLADSTLDMPFCLCWANENWTRRWDAAENEILIAQQYLPNDDIDFIKSVEPYLRDNRYIQVDGAPILIVYRPQHLPDAKRTAARWRAYCKDVGIGRIHLCAALTHGNSDYEKFGFDSGVEFPPHNWDVELQNDKVDVTHTFRGNLAKYVDVARFYIDKNYGDGCVFKTVVPSWDNTARVKERALILLNSTPGNYEYWLGETVKNTKKKKTADRNLVFINAWNEWAEG
ncbi:MAG: glycoside hydrolase family 99-like domain-containing protein, partial [Alphaproteobacteria bacterium]|nr:glycoside hydrolase family 99-like domain-containing protein [Alphaproteobacteria bacterium]